MASERYPGSNSVLYRMRHDFRYFAAACLYVVDKESQERPFVPNKAQERILKHIEKAEKEKHPVRLIIPKARQLGVSTLIDGYHFWRCWRQANQYALVAAHDNDSARYLLAKIQYFYDRLPEALRPHAKYRSKKEIYLQDLDSAFEVATASNETLGRSRTYTLAHLSEAAYYGQAGETAMASLLGGIPPKPQTSVIIESTANGMDNSFYSMTKKALEGANSFEVVFLPWWEEDEYRIEGAEPFRLDETEQRLWQDHGLGYDRLAWRRYAINNICQGSEELFCQEFPSTVEEAFRYTGSPVFHLPTLTRMRHEVQPPRFEGDIDPSNGKLTTGGRKTFQMWEAPQSHKVYTIGVDTAQGIEQAGGSGDRDYSVVQVYDVIDNKQVAVYRDRVSIELFPYIVKAIGMMYNQAYAIVESNNQGLAVLQRLADLRYRKLYKERNYNEEYPDRTENLGFRTTTKTKPIVVYNLAEMVRDEGLVINDPTTLDEMSRFSVDDKGKLGATIGHDDTVMAMAFACFGRRYAPVQTEVRKASKTQIGKPLTIDDLDSLWHNPREKELREMFH